MICKAVNEKVARVTMFYPGTKRKMLEAKVKGTTFTGHPYCTTFGNTLRMWSYVSFICEKAGITKYLNWHAGDDVLMYLTSADANLFA